MCKKTVADYPELVAQWHPTKNDDLKPEDVAAGSSKKVWWKCPEEDDHEWDSVVCSRTKGIGCPFCSRKKACLSNCLATTHPHLLEQWHPIKNGNLTSFDVLSGTTKKVWWKCPEEDDHEWEASPHKRAIREQNCPCCRGLKAVSSNCLAITHPELCGEWSEHNDFLPDSVTKGCGRSVEWICKAGHRWMAVISSRAIAGHGCPYCSNQKAWSENCISTVCRISKRIPSSDSLD